ncbi:lipoyl(octanoyl) transferase LipB [Membranicola marinus]|uniref:Octanoyltransferase n=1 Tax=Membranihabitans marinus TaxID=1227546 RepID=A0A953HRS2_9BACT|nr:lipoyl(octanoyl) transferase LipB [Membranihabitans marinus]MBY5960064.1 lipoyl(octanoyl) transferase LipB [Membranihabitans marinus]
MYHNKLSIEHWGRIDYQEAWDRQSVYQRKLVALKRTARAEGIVRNEGTHFLVLCEHHPVYTLGKSGKTAHLLVNEHFLKEHGITFYRINRGGDITYHGPGQLVAYPILDLEFFYTDIHRYVRTLEESVIRTLADYGVVGRRIEGFTGVWTGQKSARKICAIGIHMSRWVSMHGLAFNVNTDLTNFQYIVPCGIEAENMAVTSLAREVGHELDITEVTTRFTNHFTHLFNIDQCEERKTQKIHIPS